MTPTSEPATIHPAGVAAAPRNDDAAEAEPMRESVPLVSEHVRSDTSTGTWLPVCAALAGVMLCWMLLTPPGAGTDEQSHLTRVGMIANGDLTDLIVSTIRTDPVVLPTTYLAPSAECYMFEPLVSVECAVGEFDGFITADGDVELISSASGYPVWAHLVNGVAARLSGIEPIWSARAAGAVIAVWLLTAALVAARDRDRLAAAGVVVALTPTAWLTFGGVNPSTFAIAGGVALWTSLARGVLRDPRHADRWLFACGWAALVLTRRDGLIWACLTLALFTLADGRPSLAKLRGSARLPDLPALLVCVTTALMVVWAATHWSRTVQLGAAAPLAIAAAWTLRWAWDQLATGRMARAGLVTGCVALGTVAVLGSFVKRPGGWDPQLNGKVIGATGDNLIQTIGLLGWLDTMPPMPVMIAWPAMIGLLVAASLVAGWRTPLLATATLGLAIVASWVFELQNATTYGRYWQGRYWMPLVVGVPIVLAIRHGLGDRAAGASVRADTADRLARVAGVTALVALNVMAWAAARRWGVGLDGSYLPWRWDTSLHPVTPFIVLLVHAVATTALAAVLFGGSTAGPRDDAIQGTASGAHVEASASR